MEANELYDEEKKLIVKREKESFEISLLKISSNLKDKQSVDEFIIDSKEKSKSYIGKIDESKNKYLIWFNLKILGIIFMTLYITGIYMIIGLKDTVWKEIKSSATLYLTNSTRTINETFYDNYNQLNLGSPEFSLYFMTSSFSGLFFDLCGIYTQTVISLVINSLLFFGVAAFDFHTEPENINENYSIWQFLYLVLIYVLLYAFIGFISMLPVYIYSSAFDQYEIWVVNKERRRKNLPEIDENNKMKDNESSYNGYFSGFFIAILLSMALKNILNQYIIIKNFEDVPTFYGILLGCFCIPIILALIVYIIFSKIFDSSIDKKDPKAGTKSGCRCCGYVYYSESKPNPLNIKCEWLRKGFRKCYVNCCCYCCCCCCCQCFACEKCCGDEKTFEELSDASYDKEQKICVCYKSYGKFAWFCDLITKRELLGASILMYFLQIINYGFRRDLSNYLDNCEDEKRNIINILSLGGILFFYFVTVISGCIFAKGNNLKIVGESNYVGFGIVTLIFPASLVSFIASILSYWEKIPESIHYIIPFSIGSIEFYLILLKQVSKSILRTEMISFDSLFSAYMAIWTVFSSLLEILNASVSGLILTQFIITVVVAPLSFLAFCLSCVCNKKIQEMRADSNKIENKEDVVINETKEDLIGEKENEN